MYFRMAAERVDLNQLPFIKPQELFTFASVFPKKDDSRKNTEDYFFTANFPGISRLGDQLEIEEVPLNRVVSAIALNNWASVSGNLPFDVDTLSSLVHSGNGSYSEPPFLLQYWGIYIVDGPGMRIAARKYRGFNGKISAYVIPIDIAGVVAPYKEDYEILMKRKEEGLWNGTLITDDAFKLIHAIGQVKSYKYPWVFARDMEKAKDIYSKAIEGSANRKEMIAAK